MQHISIHSIPPLCLAAIGYENDINAAVGTPGRVSDVCRMQFQFPITFILHGCMAASGLRPVPCTRRHL